MYGVKSDLDLSFLIGTELSMVCVGQFQAILHFHPKGSISVEGKYELMSGSGSLLESGRPDEFRTKELLNLLGAEVKGVTLQPPDSFVLQFSTGHSLRFIDDSHQYESFQIQPGDIII